MNKAYMPIFQVKITLRDIEPTVWRRLLISSDLTLAKFHEVIQAAMGWTNSHQHSFEIGIVTFMVPYEPEDLIEMTAVDSRKVKLAHIVPHIRPFKGNFHFAFVYVYDFGDHWQHDIVFEDVLPPNPDQKTPVCLDGARACPPEDIGGPFGYQRFLEATEKPGHPEYEHDMLESGKLFQPEAFDLDRVNRRLKSIR